MKIRTDFVSNSSSTSFVISTKDFPNIAQLAMAMIPIRERDDDKELVKKIQNGLKQGRDPMMPISFRSCNYDTFIWNKNGFFLVETCSNYPWKNHLPCIWKIPNELLEDEEIKKEANYGTYSWEKKHNEYFWFPETDIVMSIVPHDGSIESTWCKKHFVDLVVLKDDETKQSLCPYCLEEEKKL